MQAIVKWIVVGVLFALPATAFEDRYFNSNGVRIRYTDQGSGEPVILVHGFAVNQEHEWVETGVLPSLVKNYRIHCHGFSRPRQERKAAYRQSIWK